MSIAPFGLLFPVYCKWADFVNPEGLFTCRFWELCYNQTVKTTNAFLHSIWRFSHEKTDSLLLALFLIFALGASAFAASFPANGFSDVSRSAWYAEAVDFVKASGLMTGVGSNRFDPNGTVTRAMVITVLYRLADKPSVKGQSNPFRDVPNGSDCWYRDAAVWGVKNGVTTGDGSANVFSPNKAITREQMATMIVRFLLSQAKLDDASAKMIQRLEQSKKRVAEIDRVISRLYEDNVIGKLSDERFMKMSASYEQEQKNLEVTIGECEQALREADKAKVDLRMLLKGLREFTELKKLTPEIVNTLIQRIEVHNSDRSTGKIRVQVDIYFTAIGLFTIPDEKELQKLMDDIRENPQKYKL